MNSMGVLDAMARLGRHEDDTLEYKLTKDEKFLFDAARGIDRIDPYIGMTSYFLYQQDNPLLVAAGAVLNASEALIFKAPFIKKYYSVTKNVGGAALLVLKTTMLACSPNFAYLQLLPTNYWVVKSHVKKMHEKREEENKLYGNKGIL